MLILVDLVVEVLEIITPIKVEMEINHSRPMVDLGMMVEILDHLILVLAEVGVQVDLD
jgi:hypothetical protein